MISIGLLNKLKGLIENLAQIVESLGPSGLPGAIAQLLRDVGYEIVELLEHVLTGDVKPQKHDVCSACGYNQDDVLGGVVDAVTDIVGGNCDCDDPTTSSCAPCSKIQSLLDIAKRYENDLLKCGTTYSSSMLALYKSNCDVSIFLFSSQSLQILILKCTHFSF